MSGYDLVVRGGEIGTATDRYHADIAIKDGRIVAIGEGLPGGDDEIDAKGRLVISKMLSLNSTVSWGTMPIAWRKEYWVCSRMFWPSMVIEPSVGS